MPRQSPITKPGNSKAISANAWGKLRSAFAKRGLKNSEINAIVGSSHGGRKKLEIADLVRAMP